MRLYIDNLAYATTEQGLKKAFEAHGTVTHCRIPLGQRTGVNQGFGYVVMKLEAEANKAIRALNASKLDGKKIEVRESRQQKKRAVAEPPRFIQARTTKPPKPRRKLT